MCVQALNQQGKNCIRPAFPVWGLTRSWDFGSLSFWQSLVLGRISLKKKPKNPQKHLSHYVVDKPGRIVAENETYIKNISKIY